MCQFYSKLVQNRVVSRGKEECSIGRHRLEMEGRGGGLEGCLGDCLSGSLTGQLDGWDWDRTGWMLFAFSRVWGKGQNDFRGKLVTSFTFV